jgi:serine/threonine protein kinase
MLRKYFLCLCQAVAYLHSPEVRVRHKDIKPENIVIDLYGNVIITDFDLSTNFTEKNKPKLLQNIVLRREYEIMSGIRGLMCGH